MGTSADDLGCCCCMERPAWSAEEIEEEIDGRREDNDRRLDAMELGIVRPVAGSANGSCASSTPLAPLAPLPPTAGLTCRLCQAEPVLVLTGLEDVLTVLPGTSNVVFLPKVGVVARWISSGGGGEVGRGGGPIFGGPGLPATGAAIFELLDADVNGGGGNRGGGGSIIIGGLVRSTLFGELGTESVPALETLDLASPVAAVEMTEALVLTLDL